MSASLPPNAGLPPNDRIRLERGDITRLPVDAIVNAANSSLRGGGGVDGAIHRAAGPGLLAECRTIGFCAAGEARLTRGYRLPAGHVIHTVGPVWRGGNAGEPELLASCYRSSLAIARDRQFRRVGFPAIATGIYGFPRDEAARIALAVVCAHLAESAMPECVIFVCFDDATLAAYRRALGPGADGPGADGPGADGLGADGPGADGLGADGLGADGPGADGLGADGPAPT